MCPLVTQAAFRFLGTEQQQRVRKDYEINDNFMHYPSDELEWFDDYLMWSIGEK